MGKMNSPKHQTEKSVPQIDRFKEAARQLEVDESETAFDEKLKGLATQKVKEKKIP